MVASRFENVKVGDVVTRMLGGSVPSKHVVVEITEDRIKCDTYPAGGITDGGWWEFDRATGMEEDEGLMWGVEYGVTGSYLVESQKEN